MNEVGAGAFVAPIVLVVFFVVFILLVILVLRAIIAGGVREGIRSARKDEDPLVILQRRYARGEIDEVEYERRRRELIGR